MDDGLRFYDRDGVRVLPVVGEFDLSNAPLLEEAIVAATDGDAPVLIVDFSEAAYIDSTVLSILIRQRKRLGLKLQIVVRKQARMRRIFEITGLIGTLAIKDSIDDASVLSTDG